MRIEINLGRRAVFGPAGLALSLLASSALGQPNAETLGELRECARIEIDRARWVCFDGVFANEATGSASARPAAPIRTAPVSAPTTTEAAPAVARPIIQSRRSEDAPKPHRIVTIIELHELARGNMRFVTSVGEIYTQPFGEQRGRYPDLPFEAELDSGAMGSIFIEPIERGPRTRISLMLN